MDIEKMEVLPKYDKKGNKIEGVFRILISDEEQNIYEIVEVEEQKLLKKNWLETVPGCYMIAHNDQEWSNIKRQLQEKAKECCVARMERFTSNGWHCIEGHPKYVLSNAVISADGIDFSSFSKAGNSYLPMKDDFSLEKQRLAIEAEHLMKIIGVNPELFYPVFLSNIAAVFNELLRPVNLSPALTFWMNGKPGSGKTELALALGSFVVDSEGSKRSLLVSANSATGIVVKHLVTTESRNLLLDDIKKEPISGQYAKLKRNIDTCVRSTFLQKLTDCFNMKIAAAIKTEAVSCGLIMTGEMIKEADSLIARIVFLQVGNYINTKEGSEALAIMQGKPEMLGAYVAGYIYFICGKIESDKGFLTECAERIQSYWKRKREVFYGSNASRLARTLAMLIFANRQVQEYHRWLGIEENCEDTSFFQSTEEILQSIMKKTETLVYEGESIACDAVIHVLNRLKIRLAQEIDIGYDYVEIAIRESILDEWNDGVYIPNPHHFMGNNEPLPPILLVKKEVFLDSVNEEINYIIETHSWEEYSFLKVTSEKLREMGIILAEKRDAHYFNNQIVFWSIDRFGFLSDCNCYAINLESPLLGFLQRSLQEREKTELKENTYNPCYADQTPVQNCQKKRSRIRFTLNMIAKQFRVVKN